jgi:hypothetical protein
MIRIMFSPYSPDVENTRLVAGYRTYPAQKCERLADAQSHL